MAEITFETDYSEAMLQWIGELDEDKCLKHNDSLINNLPNIINALQQSIYKLSELASKFGQDKDYYYNIKERLSAVKSRNKGFIYDDQDNGIIIKKDGQISNADQINKIKILNEKIRQKQKYLDDYFADLIKYLDSKAINAPTKAPEKKTDLKAADFIKPQYYTEVMKDLRELSKKEKYKEIGEYISRNETKFVKFIPRGKKSITNFAKIIIPQAVENKNISNTISKGYAEMKKC